MCGIFAYITKGNINAKICEILQNFNKIQHRGPDATDYVIIDDKIFLGFHRLAINDLSEHGMQPFIYNDLYCICNGEIYNHKELEEMIQINSLNSNSDCEIILPLFEHLNYNIEDLCKYLNGEYAFIIYNKTTGILYVGTDELRVRPIFIGYKNNDDDYMICSEMKGIKSMCENIYAVPSGTFMCSENNRKFTKYYHFPSPNTIGDNYAMATDKIRDLFIKSVSRKYKYSDAPVGFLLSGGLDSSLCCAIAANIAKPKKIRTFSVGFSKNSSDIINSRRVAEFLDTEHTEIIFDVSDGVNAIKDVIWYLETFDQTTIRAATGMFLLAKWIKENTDIKVLISGEVADELFQGYIYFKYQPTSLCGNKESIKRLKDIYMFDGLRADRAISANSLELRVPFFDVDLINYVLSLDPDFINPNNFDGKIEKKILRDAFIGWLPNEILNRHKEAFTDGVSSENGSEWVNSLKKWADEIIDDEEFGKCEHIHIPPRNKEEHAYRIIFEEHYKNNSNVIKYQWLPKFEWLPKNLQNKNIDSSATALIDLYKK